MKAGNYHRQKLLFFFCNGLRYSIYRNSTNAFLPLESSKVDTKSNKVKKI